MSRSDPAPVQTPAQTLDYKTAATARAVAVPSWMRLPLILSGVYVFMILAGILVLRLPGARVRGNEFSFEAATFTAVNAATLSGFQQAVAIDEYGGSGQACIIVLTAGGTLFALLVGAILLNRLLRLPFSDARIVGVTLFATAFAVACGTAILAEPGRGLLASAVQSLSAFGNSGIVLGRLPGAGDWKSHAALLPLAFLGGLSIPVLMEMADGLFHWRGLSKHAMTVLSLSAVLYLIGVIVLFPFGATVTDDTNRVALSSALSLDARTAGFPLAAVGSLSRVAQWLLIGLMLIGAAPAGSGGGMKVTSLFHLWRGTRRALNREGGLRITGIAATWIAAYLAIVFLTLLGLLATLPDMPADRLVFLAASAVGNVGLSHDPLAVTGGGLWIMCLAMLIGRLAPLAVLGWAAATVEDADVAVG
jgi:trk system potassium uptake protein TrkH